MSIPSHLDLVQAARQRYADLTGTARAEAICRAVVWQLKDAPEGQWGRLLKADLHTVSTDVIALKVGTEPLYCFDILFAQETDAKPQWASTQPTGREPNLRRWVAPVPVEGVTAPDPPKPDAPLPPPASDPAVLDLLQQIVASLGVLHSQMALLQQIATDTREKVEALNETAHKERGVGGTVQLYGVTGSFSGKVGGP